MEKTMKKRMLAGAALIALFVLWTFLIQRIDVKPLGQNGTSIGFAAVNTWFHRQTGVNMVLYAITDWMGLVPLLVCMLFAGIGFVQLIQRKKLLRVDADLLVLGAYYIMVIFCYALFEAVPINYRPVLINGALESSYPSSTTLLVLAVMPTLAERAARRLKNGPLKQVIRIFAAVFSAFMVVGRMVCGVHWLTDIIGSLLLCAGLFSLYRAAVILVQRKENG